MVCEELLAARKLPEVWGEDCCDWETRRKELADILQREVTACTVTVERIVLARAAPYEPLGSVVEFLLTLF